MNIMAAAELHDSLILVETAEKIYVHPVAGGEVLVINRITDEVGTENDASGIDESEVIRRIHIGCILGVINLLAGPYLLVCRSGSRVGEIRGHVVWQLVTCELVSFRRSLLHLTARQKKLNDDYLEMVNDVLRTPYFYYSFSYDLTHNLQSLENNSPLFFQNSLFERADKTFLWNEHMMSRLSNRPDLAKFCVPLIHGFVGMVDLNVRGRAVKLILLSRRGSRRAGTRLNMRGIDSNGDVANFVETEQILECDGDLSSFIQIRGSVPLYWTQRPNLKYKPPPVISNSNHAEAYERHINDLLERYNRVTCINLVNQTGSEEKLERYFRGQVESNANGQVNYEAFDFHHECRNMNWQRLEVLKNRLSGDQEDFRFFLRSKSGGLNQEGVFRTNCVDCLDRTNVVQGLLAKSNLDAVLHKLGILTEGERLGTLDENDLRFKGLWADNGDNISVEYSGTGALKADYTRTGKRSFYGLMRDGYNSMIRYVKNNFFDGRRQDSMELFLGRYRVQEGEGLTADSPLERSRGWKYYTLPALLLVSFTMFALLTFVPKEWNTEYLLYLLFWGASVGATGATILFFGKDFVDVPALVAPS